MWVHLRCNHTIVAHQLPDTLEEITFAVIEALRHHRAVQAQHHSVYGQRGCELRQDFVSYRDVCVVAKLACWVCEGRESLYEFESLGRRATPQHCHRRRAKGRFVGMLSPGGNHMRSSKLRLSVGMGLNVFVSVANEAVKTRMWSQTRRLQ